MTYLTSIELLRRVSRQLLTGKRELPPMSQLSSMAEALRYVLAEATFLNLDLVQTYVENLLKVVVALQGEAQLRLKTMMIKILVEDLPDYADNEDKRWEDCTTLSAQLKGLDSTKFSEFVTMRDKTRVIRLISDTQTIKAMTPVMVSQMSSFIDSSIDTLTELAYSYYSKNEFEETPEIIDTMRYVVARKKGLKNYV